MSSALVASDIDTKMFAEPSWDPANFGLLEGGRMLALIKGTSG